MSCAINNNSIINSSIQCKFSFIAYGTYVEPEQGKLVLDVGNQLCHGVIDHHQPGADNDCASSLVIKYPGYVLEHLDGKRPHDITLVVHISPDLDAVTSAFFAHHLIVHKELPRFSKKIASYVRDIDMGICFRHPGVVVTGYGIFAGLHEILRKQGEKLQKTPEQIYQSVMECGFSLWEYLISEMTDETDLHDLTGFNLPDHFKESCELVMHDYSVYLDDFHKSTISEVTLPKRQDGFGKLDALFTVDPKSLLFRSWARGDNNHAPNGKGFNMLAVNYKDQRYVISTDPQSPFYLKGLGDLLEKSETAKRKSLGLDRKGSPRPGYDNSDPWYDGRNPLHNYTIVDTPRNGTVLTWDEIISIIRNYSFFFNH